jgi:hypothetical protein
MPLATLTMPGMSITTLVLTPSRGSSVGRRDARGT